MSEDPACELRCVLAGGRQDGELQYRQRWPARQSGGRDRNLRAARRALAAAAARSVINFAADRPGHDRCYAIDAGKIRRQIGWQPHESFATGPRKTVALYQVNHWWWKTIGQRGLPRRATLHSVHRGRRLSLWGQR